MFRKMFGIAVLLLFCPIVVHAQGVLFWGEAVVTVNGSMSVDEYRFLYGGGAGGAHAQDDARAQEPGNDGGGGDDGGVWWDDWHYVGASGGWRPIPGTIDIGSTWADNTTTPGTIQMSIEIQCKISVKLTSEIGVNYSVVGMKVGEEILNESVFVLKSIGDVPFGYRKTFTAEAKKIGLSVEFQRYEYTYGIRTDFESTWGCIEKPDQANIGIRTS